MPLAKTTQLEAYTHIVAPGWDGFAVNPADADGGKVLGIADLLPDGAHGRRETWRITVEFEPAQARHQAG
ncbi:hypothetical protein ACSRUE_17915 [Sorangium sp. KYC3313]|uniref:hypothetical protein n=1 Tax=Sorangium sp. KYC3313 TaxID=3449740 RepID=UPI003F892569